MRPFRLILLVTAIAAFFALTGFLIGAEPTPPPIAFYATTNGKTIILTPKTPAKIRITQSGANSAGAVAAIVVNGQPEILDFSVGVTFGPAPEPGPNPGPDPNPGPKPNPTPTPGPLYVLLVYESADLVKLPIPQVSILTSKPIRDYLASHCAKDAKGEPERRFLDKDIDPIKLSPNLQKWFNEAANQVKSKGKPWLIITNGRDTFQGEWPATPDATVDLLKKYGGA